MTTIRPLSIYVDEKDMSVWVSAGVTVWDLIIYLAEFITPLAPRGEQTKRAHESFDFLSKVMLLAPIPAKST